MLESKIERDITTFAEKHGWVVYKFTSPSTAGVADRILVRQGVVIFLEIKRPSKKPIGLQYKFLRDMRKQRIMAWWTDSLEDVKDILSHNQDSRSLYPRDIISRFSLEDEDLKA